MNEVSGRRGRAFLMCAGCAQSLFGIVRYCPFCGARQPENVTPIEASAQAQPDAGNKSAARIGASANAAPLAEVVTTANSVAPATPLEAAAILGPESHALPKATQPPVSIPSPPVPVQAASVGQQIHKVGLDNAASTTISPDSSASSGKLKWIALLLMLGAGYAIWEFLLKPKPPDLCQQALETAAVSMQASQYAQARAQALSAVARCTGDAQERATTILKTAEAAQAAEDNCGKAMRQADNQISDGRLKLAARTLDSQPSACLSREEAVSRRQRIDSSATSAAEKVRQALALATEGQFDTARTSVTEAEHLDHDNPDLAAARKEIETRMRDAAKASAARVAPTPEAAVSTSPAFPVLSPIVPPPVAAPPIQQVDNAENNKRLECSVLVRAGTRALSNKSYDEAMQSAQEARSVFANCPGAQELLQSARQAKDRARQSVTIQ